MAVQSSRRYSSRNIGVFRNPKTGGTAVPGIARPPRETDQPGQVVPRDRPPPITR